MTGEIEKSELPSVVVTIRSAKDPRDDTFQDRLFEGIRGRRGLLDVLCGGSVLVGLSVTGKEGAEWLDSAVTGLIDDGSKDLERMAKWQPTLIMVDLESMEDETCDLATPLLADRWGRGKLPIILFAQAWLLEEMLGADGETHTATYTSEKLVFRCYGTHGVGVEKLDAARESLHGALLARMDPPKAVD